MPEPASNPGGSPMPVPLHPVSGTARPAEKFVGIHIAAHSPLDEGIDHCLDLLRDSAAVTAPMVSPYAYYGAMMRPLALMADHGVAKKDNSNRKLPMVWVRHRDKYFTDTSLRHPSPGKDCEYADRDVLVELAEPLRKRGMKLYVRIYEPGGASAAKHIANWAKAVEIDAAGKPLGKPCFNNPEFRAWTVGTVRDLFENYPIEGLQYGAERSGPVGGMLIWAGSPACFCPFCLARAKQSGIDGERARKGMTELHTFLKGLREGAAAPSEGALAGVLRIFMNYPEVLAWERQWHVANNDVHRLIRDAVKAIRPAADVGRHVSHVESSFDPFYRAGAPYEEMADACDFVKPILYHEIFGPRLRGYLDTVGKTVLRGLSPAQALDLFYALFGHDPAAEGGLEKIVEVGLSPEYVYRETKRGVDALQGKARMYAGIGLDIPKGAGWGTQPWPSDPERLYRAVRRAFDAGGAGIVISREYEENRVESLKVVGRAVRDMEALR